MSGFFLEGLVSVKDPNAENDHMVRSFQSLQVLSTHLKFFRVTHIHVQHAQRFNLKNF